MSKLAKFAIRKAKEKAAKTWQSNPPIKQDLVQFVVPGAVAFGATNIAMNLGQRMLGTKLPGPWSRLAGGAVMAGGLWALVHYFGKAKKYHGPVVVGAGLAMLAEAAKTFASPLAPVFGHQAPAKALAPQTPVGHEYPPLPDLGAFEAPVPQQRAMVPVKSVEATRAESESLSEGEDMPSSWQGAWGAIEDEGTPDGEFNDEAAN